MRKKITIVTCCAVLVAIVLVALGFVLSRSSDDASPITRTIEGDTINITISGNRQQRTVIINELEAGRRITLTTTTRRVWVRRQAVNEPPPLPRRQVHHNGDVVQVYTVGNVLIIVELATNRRHYI